MDLFGNPKQLALGVVVILVLGITLYILIRPAFVDRDLVIEKRLEDEITQKDREIRRLGKENRKLQDINKDLEIRITELLREIEGGLAMEETRKASMEREVRLTSWRVWDRFANEPPQATCIYRWGSDCSPPAWRIWLSSASWRSWLLPILGGNNLSSSIGLSTYKSRSDRLLSTTLKQPLTRYGQKAGLSATTPTRGLCRHQLLPQRS